MIATWFVVGIILVFSSPFRSGTDESINYVAFSAAKKRWATEQDFHDYGINFFYYPPLYFLLFTPWPGSEAMLSDVGLSSPWYEDNYQSAGGTVMVRPEVSGGASRELVALYRAARLASLLMGLAVVASLFVCLLRLRLWERSPFVCLLILTSLLCLPQFLYYTTLCNNDNLLNALSALAVMFFVLAVTNAQTSQSIWRRERWSLAMAICIGLALLTKQSAVVLLFFVPAMALHVAMRSASIKQGGILGAILHGAALLLIAFLFGGWWYLRQWWLGDLLGLNAARLAHEWAFLEAPLWQVWGWQRVLLTIWRTTYGLFTGPIHGLSDGLFVGYALLTLLLLIVALIGIIRWHRSMEPGTRNVLIPVLACFCVLNLLMVILNCRTVMAPYGRLLFPSLVPFSLVLAVGMSLLLERQSRVIRLIPLAVCAVYVVLMASVVTTRLYPAVIQNEEHLYAIVHPDAPPSVMQEAAWGVVLVQPLKLQPGDLIGFRVHVPRDAFPTLGGGVRAALIVDGVEHRIPLIPFSSTDGTDKWMRLPLPETVAVTTVTDAILALEGIQPWMANTGNSPRFAVSTHEAARDAGTLQVNGRASQLALRVTLEYDGPIGNDAPATEPVTLP